MRLATVEDLSLAIRILSESFDSNPSVNWVIKNDKKRKRRIKALAAYSFKTALRRRGAFISSQNNGIALCYKANTKEAFIDYWQQFILTIRSIGIFRIPTVLKRESYVNSVRPKDGNYLYFWFYGVLPGKNGLGDAIELKNEIFALADREKLPIYLETSIEKNRLVYLRYGFELYHTWFIKRQSINLYFMRRIPRKNSNSGYNKV